MYSEYLLALFHAELFQISYRNLLLYIPWLCLRFAFWLEFKINLIALNTFLILVVTLPFHHCCHHTKWRIKDDVPMLYTVSDLFIFFATLEARHVYSGFGRGRSFLEWRSKPLVHVHHCTVLVHFAWGSQRFDQKGDSNNGLLLELHK